MTCLEVHHAGGVKRWPIGEMPGGTGHEGYVKRLDFVQRAVAHYKTHMAYAFKDATVYIVHEAKFESYADAEKL